MNAMAVEPDVNAILRLERPVPLPWRQALFYVTAGALAFHAAFGFPAASWLIIVYAYSLIALARAATARLGFRYGFALGLLTFSPQLFWFWNIFGVGAICLCQRAITKDPNRRLIPSYPTIAST